MSRIYAYSPMNGYASMQPAGGSAHRENLWDDPGVLVQARYPVASGWTWSSGFMTGLTTGIARFQGLAPAGMTDADVAAGTAGVVVRVSFDIDNYSTDGSTGYFGLSGEIALDELRASSNGSHSGVFTLDGASTSSIYLVINKGDGSTISGDITNIRIERI